MADGQHARGGLYSLRGPGCGAGSVIPRSGPGLAADKKLEILKLFGGVMVPIVLLFNEVVSKSNKSLLCSKAGAGCVGASLLC